MTGKCEVLEALRSVRDPSTRRDIVSLEMVREVCVRDGYVHIHLELPLNSEGMRLFFTDEIRKKAGALDGVKDVTVEFSRKKEAGSFLPKRRLDADIRHVIAIASGKGGVGKTTVAVNLALALLREGYKVGLMDGDIYGPNVPIMLGIDPKQRPEVSENNKMRPIEVAGLRMISMGVLVPPDQPMVWRGPKLHGAVTQFIQQVEWGELDFLLVDLPPGTGDVQLSLVQSVSLSGAVMVTTPQEVALLDVRKGIGMFQKTNVALLGIIENMSGEVFGRGGGQLAARQYGIPFLGEIPLDARIREGGDRGRPILLVYPESPAARAFIGAAQTLTETMNHQLHQT